MENVLLVGNGGRENALAWKLDQEGCKVYFAFWENVSDSFGTSLDLKAGSKSLVKEIISVCKEYKIDLVTITQEEYLARGLADRLRNEGILVFGPSRQGARIEWSKVWANSFFEQTLLPDFYARGVEWQPWINFEENFRVVKADGLAKGKGVKIAPSVSQVDKVALQIKNEFPQAGERILIQEFLEGREVSAHAFVDARNCIHLPLSVDFKRFENESDNTGGVAAYSQPRWVNRETELKIQEIMENLVKMLSHYYYGFTGMLYGGFIITEKGPKLIEVNGRPGDPETQVLLPRIRSKIFPILLESAMGKFSLSSLEIDRRQSFCRVLCSEGYPQKPKTGRVIKGLEELGKEILVFPAGIGLNNFGKEVTTAGRVVSLVALGESLEEAKAKVDAATEKISFKGLKFRKEINF